MCDFVLSTNRQKLSNCMSQNGHRTFVHITIAVHDKTEFFSNRSFDRLHWLMAYCNQRS